MSYIDPWGLIAPTKTEPHSENALLFSVEHNMLTGDAEEVEHIFSAIEHCRDYAGIYVQHPSRLLQGGDRYMSRDQLIAIFAFSYKNGLYFHKEIWREIKRQLFRYNNIEVPKTLWQKITNIRLIMPQDLIFYGLCAGGPLWKLLIPILLITGIITVLKKKKIRPEWYKRLYYKIKGIEFARWEYIATDGKLLQFVQLQALKERSWFWEQIWKLNTYLIRRTFGSWNAVFKIYFPFEDHPNVVDSAKI